MNNRLNPKTSDGQDGQKYFPTEVPLKDILVTRSSNLDLNLPSCPEPNLLPTPSQQPVAATGHSNIAQFWLWGKSTEFQAIPIQEQVLHVHTFLCDSLCCVWGQVHTSEGGSPPQKAHTIDEIKCIWGIFPPCHCTILALTRLVWNYLKHL